ncbi:hypothetical protein BDQ94DRAFT_161000 [Aspergillus welwitschiae]|uniref:Aminoglycoside phosphotransferase domain-containing protein n=1 Tax=Aspergillus welwitschiae TaxID=1341132 RepID=A0A3F3PV40_9EURO|nr:hypothetical protein BDQ94DRAFT_161000 [Aspergillus welwitschiae]RDH30794.1 hypothetical protein BDQ94DRAFT_161000 [Aspergillus welwitschiae]
MDEQGSFEQWYLGLEATIRLEQQVYTMNRKLEEEKRQLEEERRYFAEKGQPEEERQLEDEIRKREKELAQQGNLRKLKEEVRYLQEQYRQHEEEMRQHEKEMRQHEEETKQPGEKLGWLVQKTTFLEYIQHLHEALPDPLNLEPRADTHRDILIPKARVCPERLEHWSQCDNEQEQIYRHICEFFEPTDGPPKRIFTPFIISISFKEDLEIYLQDSVQMQIEHIIEEICAIPAARAAFHLGGDRMRYVASHGELRSRAPTWIEDSERWPPGPESFCIHDMEDGRRGIDARLRGEFILPNKLTMETLRAGLWSMDSYAEVLHNGVVPLTEAERITRNATRLAGSALVQLYNEMISYGFEYGYITTGEALVLLKVPYDNPSTILYRVCEPSIEATPGNRDGFLRPVTAIARILCLCLMSCASQIRSPDWCIKTKASLPTWLTGFDYEYFIQTQKFMPSDDYSGTTTLSPHSICGQGTARELPIRPRSQTSSVEGTQQPSREEVQDGEPYYASGHKRRLIKSGSSASPAPEQQSKRSKRPEPSCSTNPQQDRPFCTQKCLLGLKESRKLDENCPNLELHQQSGSTFHLHGVGKIRHMLMMGWGGEPINKAAYEQGAYKKYLKKALTPVRDLGVLHGDLSAGHLLWNEELNRLMLIDFNRCRLSLPNPVEWKPKWLTEWDSLAKEEEKDYHRQHCSFHRTCIHPLTRSCPNEKFDVC